MKLGREDWNLNWRDNRFRMDLVDILNSRNNRNFISLKIFQLTMLCLDRLCEQKDFFKDLIENKQPFASACKKPYLKIQCKDNKKCTCLTKKKSHFQKHPHRSSKKGKKPYRYFKKKDPSQFRKKKHNRCFICKKQQFLPEITQTSLPKLFASFNIYNNLQCFPNVWGNLEWGSSCLLYVWAVACQGATLEWGSGCLLYVEQWNHI